MKKILSISYALFAEIIRDRTIPVIIMINVFLLLFVVFLGPISLGAANRMILDMGLAVLNFTSLFIIVFLGTRIVSQEIDDRTIYFVLSKPITPLQFILGKFFGMGVVLIVVYFFISIFYILFVKIVMGYIPSLTYLAIFLSYFKSLFLLSLTIFFSVIATPVSSGVFSFFFYIVGTNLSDMLGLINIVKNEFISRVIDCLYIILPNFEIYNINRELIYNISIPFNKIVIFLLYGIGYTVFFIFVSSIIYERKEIG